MKQILLTVAMLAVAVAAGAQNKDQLLSSIEKTEMATRNEKKASNPNTWIKYGDALYKAYEAMVSPDYRVGWSATEVAMFNTQMPLSNEQKEINGVQYYIEHYALRDLWMPLSLLSLSLKRIFSQMPVMPISRLRNWMQKVLRQSQLLRSL